MHIHASVHIYVYIYTYTITNLFIRIDMNQYVYTYRGIISSRILALSLSLSLSRAFSLSLSRTLLHVRSLIHFVALTCHPPPTHVTTRHQHGLHTAHMRIVRTINGARNPRPACGVGSSRRVDMCHVWPTMCAAATGMFGHTCWPSLRARVPAFEAPLSHLECLSSTSLCHARVCLQTYMFKNP